MEQYKVFVHFGGDEWTYYDIIMTHEEGMLLDKILFEKQTKKNIKSYTISLSKPTNFENLSKWIENDFSSVIKF